MGVCGQLHAQAALPPGMTRYPLYRRLGRAVLMDKIKGTPLLAPREHTSLVCVMVVVIAQYFY
jgi:hypothetical protein